MINELETEIEFEEVFMELMGTSNKKPNPCQKYCCIKPEKNKISKLQYLLRMLFCCV